MADNGDSVPVVGNNENLTSDVMPEIQNLRSDLFDTLNKQLTESEENKNTNEQKLTDIMDKLQSIEDLVSKIQPEAVDKEKDAVFVPPFSSSLPVRNPNEDILGIGKSFVLKHVFKNVENFENDTPKYSRREDHFGIEWYIQLMHKGNNLEFYLHVDYPGEGWEIETESDLKIIGSTKTVFTEAMRCCYKEKNGRGYSDYLNWEVMKNNYLVDGNLTAEVHVKIIETKGLRKEKIRSFDESVKEVSDIVLVVKDRKFHVNKTFLAAQSSFFKALLLGNFSESKKSEITLTGIDPEDFHFFLEILYGEPAIDESNVEGIALIADMYDAPTAIRRCEEFMLEKSRKLMKRKLHMADQYNMGVLKKKCLSQVKSLSGIRAVVPKNIEDLQHSTIAALLKKAISVKEL